MIEVSNLSKRYGDFTAVDDLSFVVRPGEVMGLVGPNGTAFPGVLSGSGRICATRHRSVDRSGTTR